MFTAGQLTFSTKKQDAFLSAGVCYWKDALKKFRSHQKSECHREAVLKLDSTTVTDLINPLYLEQKQMRSKMVKKSLAHYIVYVGKA